MRDGNAFWNGRLADYQAALQRYFRRRVRRDDVEELAQEVYLRLLRADQTGNRSIENPEAYLFAVAGNLLKERAILQRRAGPNVNIEEVILDLAAAEPAPDERLYRDRRDRQLAAAIADLPPRCRTVLLMHYDHEMTYQEIGARIGVTPHAVKKYVSHALALCRRALQEAGHRT